MISTTDGKSVFMQVEAKRQKNWKSLSVVFTLHCLKAGKSVVSFLGLHFAFSQE